MHTALSPTERQGLFSVFSKDSIFKGMSCQVEWSGMLGLAVVGFKKHQN
jgi:hypothetical protein